MCECQLCKPHGPCSRVVVSNRRMSQRSAEDGAFIAEVPDLPGCMADGATEAGARANAEVIAAEWIETARELGRAIPDASGGRGGAI